MRIYLNLVLIISFLFILSFTTNAQNDSDTKFRVAAGGGYAYRLFKSSPKIPQKVEDDLRNGYVLDADFHYFFKRPWGIGLSVNYSKTDTDFDKNNPVGVSNLYIGPIISAKHETNKFLFMATTGLGLLQRVETVRWGNYKRSTVGSVYYLTGEYKLAPKLGLGAKLGAVMGNVRMEGEDVSASSLFVSGFLSFRAK